MLGVAVAELRRRQVGAQAFVELTVPAQELPDLGVVGEVVAQGTATNLGDDGVRIELNVEATLEAACARCLKDVRLPLAGEAQETYHEAGEPPLIAMDTVDVEPAVREAIVLAQPMRVLCSPDCRGICPQCGKDLNEGPCGCGEDERDPRMAPLARLLPPREE